VTGARRRLDRRADTGRRIRAHTSLPIALGFGLSRPEHVAEVGLYADAAVVGRRLVSLIADAADRPTSGSSGDLVGGMKRACRWHESRDDQERLDELRRTSTASRAYWCGC
jgi:tryptophan synthase alpha chain